ncbi:unnamed protein product [Rangifer tarandus platyrhynchus]|uniref:Uncharacterized protein n=1 Tax=Rangifer tarandus platyrhynchus TaxID=3082113 RepID=A0ABN9A498_RANTA|nr:unnamed protein product [Rangifer tarandus platyrhynchus]
MLVYWGGEDCGNKGLLISYSNGELRMGLEGTGCLLLTILTALRMHNIGLFPQFLPLHPWPPYPTRALPSLETEPLSSLLPLSPSFLLAFEASLSLFSVLSSFSLCAPPPPNSPLEFPEGSGSSCQMLNPGLSCFLGEGRRLVSRQAPLLLGDGGLRARPYQVSLSALGLLVEREKEGFGLLPCPSPLCGIVFPTLVLIFLPIAIFPNNPCREYVPSRSRRASLRPALVGDGTVLLYRC